MKSWIMMLTLGGLLALAGVVAGKGAPESPLPSSCDGVPRWPQVCPYSWGGPGHDFGGRSERYRACCAGEEISLRVDAVETLHGVGAVTLVTPSGLALSSRSCHKAERHKSAPWACSWSFGELASLSGLGRIRVEDRAGRQQIDDMVDLDMLSLLGR